MIQCYDVITIDLTRESPSATKRKIKNKHLDMTKYDE
jgi:hypothetical protein